MTENTTALNHNMPEITTAKYFIMTKQTPTKDYNMTENQQTTI